MIHQAVARNIDPRPRERYRVSPEDLLAVEKRARSGGLEVVGFWHSHLASRAIPSTTDRDEAWEDTTYLIVSLAGVRPELRAWRLAGGRWSEQEIVGASVSACEDLA